MRLALLPTFLPTLAAALLFTSPALAQRAPQPKDRPLHRWTKQQLSDTFYSEGATLGDINGDGKPDIISGPIWYEGPDFKKARAFYEPKPFDIAVYSDNFFAFTHDFNADGQLDILIIGFPGKEAIWYANPGPAGYDKPWPRHVIADIVDNESPTFTDLTGDGKPEIVCSSGGFFGYFAPDWSKPQEKWTFRKISPEKVAGGKFTHGLGVGDINGDGRADLLEKNGWWEQPSSLDGDPVWAFHPFKFGPGGAQMYAYDVNGDKLADIITSDAAHGWGLTWWEQAKTADGQITFKRHPIMTNDPNANAWGVAFSQLHAIDLIDIDGDGLKDIVTGKRFWAHRDKDPGSLEPAVVYWFRLTRKDGVVDFVPYPVDNDSGVGTQVVAGDVNGDKLPDIIVGNKKGTFVHKHAIELVTANDYTYAHWPGMATVGYSPKAAAARMTVPKGFKVSLVAGEPDVHQPITIATDHRGRLWVAENYAYPNWAPEGRDRILILEDKDGDGEYETKKVFYDKINFVSGMEVGHGGVWVGAPPYLLFIPDKDGDDVPDSEPVKLLDGWTWPDTHETVNGFQWGPDGWLYGTHGVFNPSRVGKVGSPDSERLTVNAAVWRYHPTKHVFEVFASGTSNPWGVDFNDRGQAFISACVIPHAWHMIQGGRYHRQAGPHENPHTYDDIKTIGDHVHYATKAIRDQSTSTDEAGGGHAHCGVMMYLGDNFPAEYRDTMFMFNIRGSRMNRDLPVRDGSGYVAKHASDFVVANDRWFRGLALRYGPDGSIFFCDWYDKKVCHQQRPDDRTNGRLYRISYGDPKPVQIDVAKLTDAQLVELQLHANDWHVRMARRVMQERAAAGKLDTAAVWAALKKILAENKDETRQLRAMWALHVTGGFSDDLAAACLRRESEYVRAWAIQLLTENKAPASSFLSTFAEMARGDQSPVVRLYLAAALQRLPLNQRWDIAAGLLTHAADAEDHNIPLMVWYGVEPLVVADPARAMTLAAQSKLPKVTRFLARRAAAENTTLAAAVAALGSAAPATQTLLLDGIIDALKERPGVPMPDGWSAVYDRLVAGGDAAAQEKADYIAVKFGDKRIFPAMRRVLEDGKNPLPRRKQALEILVNGKDPQVVPILHSLVARPGLKSEAMRALAGFDDPGTPAVILKAYPQLIASQRAEAIATLISRPAYAAALVQGIESGIVPARDVTAFQVRQIEKLGDKQLTARLTKAWGSIRQTSADKAALMEKYQKLLTPRTLAAADLSSGRAVFNRTCMACHKLFGAGGEIGPDITGANRTDVNYVLENVVDPSAIIGKDYQLTTAQLKDGRFIAGIIEKESADAVIFKTQTEKIVAARTDITKMETLNVSMMPEGLLMTLKDDEVRDLMAYLAAPGQVPLPGEKPAASPAPAPGKSVAPLKVDGALEGESLKAAANSGKVRVQVMSAFKDGRWSDNKHLWWTDATPGSYMTIAFNVAQPGKYRLQAVLTKAPDYAIVKLRLNGNPVGGEIDLYDKRVVTSDVVDLGVHDLKAGEHTLQVEIAGANPAAIKRHMFALDYLKLVKQ